MKIRVVEPDDAALRLGRFDAEPSNTDWPNNQAERTYGAEPGAGAKTRLRKKGMPCVLGLGVNEGAEPGAGAKTRLRKKGMPCVPGRRALYLSGGSARLCERNPPLAFHRTTTIERAVAALRHSLVDAIPSLADWDAVVSSLRSATTG